MIKYVPRVTNIAKIEKKIIVITFHVSYTIHRDEITEEIVVDLPLIFHDTSQP